LPPRIIEGALDAIFFIAMIPTRRWLASRDEKLRLWHLSVVGLPVGYLTGFVVSTGPLRVLIFLSYGLVKGAFLATEDASHSRCISAKPWCSGPWCSAS
jgi:hypothetical protein